MDTLAAEVGAKLKSHGLMLATAESCTGGSVAQAVTDVDGSSIWFERGFVTYSNVAKEQMLGVREETLEQHGAVSERVVREMVAGALWHSNAQIALAVSGIAGPGGGTAEKPVGTVWFAWGLRDGETHAIQHHIDGNRSDVRNKAVLIALQGVLELVENSSEVA